MEKKSLIKFGLSGSALKLIAVISMFIDHLGAALVLRIIYSYGNVEAMKKVLTVFPFFSDYRTLTTCYNVMRAIGRIAFPIYCFLLVEGVKYTRNIRKYILRLGIFALVSEIPFDLCFNNSVLEFSSQNVYFTLFAGVIAVAGMKWAGERKWHENTKINRLIMFLVWCLFGAASMAMAHFLYTDYAATGVACIIALALGSSNKIVESIIGALVFTWEIPAPLAFIPTLLYNGKRGWNIKYFFYVFYPAHLLLIYLFCVLLGVA